MLISNKGTKLDVVSMSVGGSKACAQLVGSVADLQAVLLEIQALVLMKPRNNAFCAL